MRHNVSAMDLWFATTVGTYPLEVRCDMLATLGYDAIAPTLWSDEAWHELDQLTTVATKHGLGLSSVFAYLETPDDEQGLARIARLLADSSGTTVALGIFRSGASGVGPSDARGDDRAVAALERLLAAASEHQTLVLYPHWTWWLESTTDAMRLIDRIGDPRLRVSFSAYHWFAADGTDVGSLLDRIGKRLELVNLSSATVGPTGPVVAQLGHGELDTFALLGAIDRAGYKGPIELLGYGVGGDIPARLQESLGLLRETERRLDESTSWRVDTAAISPNLPTAILRDKNWTFN